jgi:hypothetical protein
MISKTTPSNSTRAKWKTISQAIIFHTVLALAPMHVNSQNDSIAMENAFDFWVGNWEVSWKAPDSTIVKGTNNVIKILDGKVIQENFVDPSRNFKGTSISVFNPQTSQWHQAWADNQGGYYNFTGVVTDKERIFEMAEKDDRGARYRMVFSDITPDSLVWKWQGIREGWEDWKTVWKINYKRKP